MPPHCPRTSTGTLRAPQTSFWPLQVCLVVMNESHLPSEEKLGDDGTWPLGAGTSATEPLAPSRTHSLPCETTASSPSPLKDSTLTNGRPNACVVAGVTGWVVGVTGWAKVAGEAKGAATPNQSARMLTTACSGRSRKRAKHIRLTIAVTTISPARFQPCRTRIKPNTFWAQSLRRSTHMRRQLRNSEALRRGTRVLFVS